jgi:ankyrin repeat protein
MRNSIEVVRYGVGIAEEQGYPIPVSNWLQIAFCFLKGPEVIDYLIEKFNINLFEIGESVIGAPLDVVLAAKCSSCVIAKAILEHMKHKPIPVPCEALSFAHDPALVRLLLAAKVSVSGADNKYPVLLSACARLSLESVKLLLEAGADANESANGCTPLFYAVTAKCPADRVQDKIAIINTLLDAGAGTDEIFSDLMSTCETPAQGMPKVNYGAEAVLASLLKRIPWLLHERGDDGATALMKMTKLCPDATQMIEMLIDAGADAHARDDKGVSATAHLLMLIPGWPARGLQRIRQSLRLLLEVGVDPAECSGDGTTLLMRAVSSLNSRVSQEPQVTADRASCMYIVELVNAHMSRSAH